MEDRSSRRPRTLVTLMAQRGLSANELSGALISMMARSTRFTQRPDTLMQDRHRHFAEPSCDARPDHTYGSIAAVDAWPRWVDRVPHFARLFRHTGLPEAVDKLLLDHLVTKHLNARPMADREMRGGI